MAHMLRYGYPSHHRWVQKWAKMTFSKIVHELPTMLKQVV